MDKWEYKTVKLDTTTWIGSGNIEETQLDDQMNRLGNEGWELVSALDTNATGGISKYIVTIFKRKK